MIIHPDVPADFVCPVCSHESYEQSVLDREGNPSIYRCAGCGFAFVSPQRYNKAARARDWS
jgi:transcription elongation factor Elf1